MQTHTRRGPAASTRGRDCFEALQLLKELRWPTPLPPNRNTTTGGANAGFVRGDCLDLEERQADVWIVLSHDGCILGGVWLVQYKVVGVYMMSGSYSRKLSVADAYIMVHASLTRHKQHGCYRTKLSVQG